MKVIPQSKAKKFQNSRYCEVLEYGLNDKDINAALVTITGRYPDKGYTVNKACKELVLVIAGRGKVVIEEKVFQLRKGSVILIEPGEKFFWEGRLTMFMPCTPAWYPAQHIKVD
ncbi:AraC family ligand binding domain-containing protein [Candidatus Woesebacteria bacterium]|nr:MAG: AraC family ligand binding domain-containing protein [Candidatus Woesebacteria bacterium]